MFQDISELVARQAPVTHGGMTLFDADGDGLSELFVCGRDGPSSLWKWANGKFRDVAPPFLAMPESRASSAGAADADGDGCEELYIACARSHVGGRPADRLLHIHPDGQWRDLLERDGPSEPEEWSRAVAVIDRRGTGRHAFLTAHGRKAPGLHEVSPDGSVSDLAPALTLNVQADIVGFFVAPLVSERLDLFCAARQGSNRLFVNQGDGRFEENAAPCGVADSLESARLVTGFDPVGSGRYDLACMNHEGPNRLWRRESSGFRKNRATPAFALPGVIRSVIAADFDNDGLLELFFHCHEEPNRLFRLSTPESDWRLTTSGAATSPPGAAESAVAADIDGDGMLELILAQGRQGGIRLYRARANDNHWFRVQPLTHLGAPARGALVQIIAGGHSQSRLIDCGGSSGQGEPVAHFGLGKVSTIDTLQVRWPDGAVKTLQNLKSRTLLRVPYPSGA